MPIKSVWLGLNFEEAALNHIKESYTGENYAVELCAKEKAHLSVFLAAPIFKIPGVIPGAGLIPAWNEPADEVNANRRGRAEEAQKRLASAAKSARVTAEFHIAQDSYATLRENLIASARPSDVVILSRPGHYLSFERSMIEAVLFTSGRPIVLVPPEWGRGARLEKIVAAWDGGGRAARAIGDAMPFLSRANEVEILCVSADASKNHPERGHCGAPRAALQESGGNQSSNSARWCSPNHPVPCSDDKSRSIGDGWLCPSPDVGNNPWRRHQ
jgi:hypothetical protein